MGKSSVEKGVAYSRHRVSERTIYGTAGSRALPTRSLNCSVILQIEG